MTTQELKNLQDKAKENAKKQETKADVTKHFTADIVNSKNVGQELKNIKEVEPEAAPAKEVSEPVKQSAAPMLPDIKLSESGELIGSSLYEQVRIANYYVKSRLLPDGLDTPEKALIALQFVNSLGLKPSVAIRQVAVINGKPSIFGDLPLAIVRQSGKLEYIKEIFLDKDLKEICLDNKNITSDVYACVCKVKRFDVDAIERFFTIKDAERAGLLSSTCWKKYPKDMLKYRARSVALKDLFSDVLSGVAISEYDYDVLPEKNITKMQQLEKTENEKDASYFLEASGASQNPDNISSNP